MYLRGHGFSFALSSPAHNFFPAASSKVNMLTLVVRLPLLLVLFVPLANAQNLSTPQSSEPALPYSPSLDRTSMDTSVNPCVDFYHYACGNWQKKNPIPPDQISWSVYAKLYQDNLTFLRGMLEQAAQPDRSRDSVTQKIGDFYAACMDEAKVEKRGLSAIQPELDAIAQVKSLKQLTPLVARLQLTYGSYGYRSPILFSAGSAQDPDNSEQVIADVDQGGLGLPDRDYYVKQDAKSKETRQGYVEHIEKLFELMGQTPEVSQKNGETILRMETALAKASLTRVERRNPHNLVHKMKIADLAKLAPSFDWVAYYHDLQYPRIAVLNVDEPAFIRAFNALLASEPLENWKTYLVFHIVDTSSPYLSSKFAQENFDFYRKYLRGAQEMQPRWERCVRYTDYNLGEALGEVYVAKVFSPALKQDTLDMVRHIEDAMAQRIRNLDWMSPETKRQALEKLAGIRNKIGYPDKWRDYSSVMITRTDFAGDVERAHRFESRRDINKIDKPVDHGEWDITPTTVDAYYNPQMNDINFPAAVLQPPLYDPRMDAAPNYGDTGGTIGHELTHGFDDEGSQFDAKGNLRNWWTKDDREKFDARTKCVADQYSSYIATGNVHVNGELTLGENVADLGGEILAYMAWKDATKNLKLQPIEGLTPDQRFFIGFAQWDCANERPEDLRMRATVDPHSPAIYRINGVVVNMPQFGQAFSCRQGEPMVKPPAAVCKVW
jgi:putative endopeptidase